MSKLSGEIFANPLVKEILKKTRTLWALGHAMSLMSWDLETYMPRKGIASRSAAFEELSALARRLLLDPELVSLVERAQKAYDDLNDYEKGVVRVLSREIRIAKAIPEDLVRREAKVTSEATVVWAEAKKENNYSKFKPYLEEIVNIAREKAEKLGYEDHPYDALLDLYEEGLRTATVRGIFEVLVPATKRVLEKVRSSGFYPERHELEERKYDVDAARGLLRKLLDVLGWPWDRGRLDESPHPFTIEMGVHDVRITVRYEGVDIKRAVYSLVHEYGHALYELQVDPRLEGTPIAGGASLGVHESQSRFWENVVGRGPQFVATLKRLLDDSIRYTRDYDLLEIYRYVNTVRPSLIRVDADEVTYNLHIYLRFNLELKLIEGRLTADDLPAAWDDAMEELLGVRPKSYSEGVLQDIHWSHGSIGYFPTYTLGNVIAAMLWRKLRGTLEKPGTVEVEELKRWLREEIHRWGKTYSPQELLVKVLGSAPDARALVEYLEWKYIELPNKIEEYLSSS